MVDPDFIRKNPQRMKEIIESGRGKPEKADVDAWLKLDEERRSLLKQLDDLNQEKNKLAEVGKKGGNIDEVRAKGQELKQKVNEIEPKLTEVTAKWQQIMDWMPNIPHKDMPAGKNEHDNLALKAWLPESGYINADKLGKVGESSQLMPKQLLYADKEFTPVHHLDLGERLGVIDNKQAGKISGTRFTYIVGELALLQYALQRFFFEELLKRGFSPIIPPLLVRELALYGTSHFPEQVDQVYKIDTEYVEENLELYLVGSSEPSNFSFFAGKVLEEKQLPYKLFAYTSCFRSEAGSWGRDTKGIKRLHQFDKIEMNVVCTPEQSDDIYDELLAINEWLLQQLKLPYHLALKCTGDAGYQASAKQIDPEVWLCGQQEFMEVMTDTNATDFQARRLNIKYKTANGEKKLVHTVNDTGIAMGRMLVAIMDNYQQSDGTILVPEVLQPLFGKKFIGK
jgi:seryl-tRNA synthetase